MTKTRNAIGTYTVTHNRDFQIWQVRRNGIVVDGEGYRHAAEDLARYLRSQEEWEAGYR